MNPFVIHWIALLGMAVCCGGFLGSAAVYFWPWTFSKNADLFFHSVPPNNCQHDFQGWREFEDGLGDERVCTKCGMGAMEHALRNDPT